MPPKKIDQLADLMRAGNWKAAIRFASKFPRLGDEEANIRRAASALISPETYAQMGRDPDRLILEGIAALKRRYPQILA